MRLLLRVVLSFVALCLRSVLEDIDVFDWVLEILGALTYHYLLAFDGGFIHDFDLGRVLVCQSLTTDMDFLAVHKSESAF